MNEKRKIVKTTLGDINHGNSRTRNNSRYSGRSVVWAVEVSDGNWCAADRLWLAIQMAEFAATWDGKGDFELCFLQRGSATKDALHYLDSSAHMEPCFTPESQEV